MEKIPKMIGVLCVLIGVLCCETCRNIPQKTLNVGVYQEESQASQSKNLNK